MSAHLDAPRLTTIEVNGKHFVSGLTWVALTKPHGYMDEARRIGKERNMDMVAIRKPPVSSGMSAQAGFAPKSPQKLRGMYSLAAALSGQLGNNFIGIFRLTDERYAFIAVHNGVVMAGRDMVADRETVESEFNDVFNLLSSESTSEKWIDTGRIVAPDDWDFATEHASLEQLLHPKRVLNEHRLRPLTFGLTAREIVAIAACIVVLIGAAFGFLQWQKSQERKRTAEATAQRLALEELAAAKAQEEIAKPWETEPAAATVLTACQDHWEAVPLSVGGWVFAKGACNAKGAAATFERPEHGTTVTAFTAAAVAAGFPAPAMYDVGTSAVFVRVLHTDPKTTDELPSNAAALQTFTNTMQQSSEVSGTQFQLTELPWEPPADQPNATVPDWKTTRFQVKTLMNPALLFASIPPDGFRIREITVDLNHDDASLTWNITGELYGR